jgi:hypothetical protein
MIPVGGLRARLLQDSVQQFIENSLIAFGWFDAGRSHGPIEFVATPIDWSRVIQYNAITVSTRSRSADEDEVGSNLTQRTVFVNVDIYAESESLAVDLSNDVRDLLRGRLPGGATNGSLPILDYRMATPDAVGHATVIEVRATRVPTQTVSTQPHTKHWFGVDATLLDHYYDSSEAP